jgi:hypothetical protein
MHKPFIKFGCSKGVIELEKERKNVNHPPLNSKYLGKVKTMCFYTKISIRFVYSKQNIQFQLLLFVHKALHKSRAQHSVYF